MIKTSIGSAWTCSTEDQEFYKAAYRYCVTKKLHLKIKKLMAKLEREDPDGNGDQEYGYIPTCWAALREGVVDFDMMCDACQRHQRLYEERIKIGKLLSKLAKRMYAASRRL